MIDSPLIVMSGGGLVVGSIPGLSKSLQYACDTLRPVLDEQGFFQNAPFSWVGISVLYGVGTELGPVFVGQSKKTGIIEYRMVLDAQKLYRLSIDELNAVVLSCAVFVLLHLAKKHHLPAERLLELWRHYADKSELREFGLDVLPSGATEKRDDSRNAGGAEIHIEVPLDSDAGRVTMDQILALDKELDKMFEESGSGWLETNEIGGGTCVFIVVGRHLEDLLAVARKWAVNHPELHGTVVIPVADCADPDSRGEPVDLI